MADTRAPICASCTELRMKWLDSKPSQLLPAFGIAHGSGADYDVSARGLRDRSRSRHQQWAALVREQMSAIATACRNAGHSIPAPAPVVVQLDLLNLSGLGDETTEPLKVAS